MQYVIDKTNSNIHILSYQTSKISLVSIIRVNGCTHDWWHYLTLSRTDLSSGSYPSNRKLWWCQTQPHCNLTNLPAISWQAGEERKNRADSLSAHDKRTREDNERDKN